MKQIAERESLVAQLVKANETIHALQSVTAAYKDDIKTRNMLEDRLRREMKRSEISTINQEVINEGTMLQLQEMQEKLWKERNLSSWQKNALIAKESQLRDAEKSAHRAAKVHKELTSRLEQDQRKLQVLATKLQNTSTKTETLEHEQMLSRRREARERENVKNMQGQIHEMSREREALLSKLATEEADLRKTKKESEQMESEAKSLERQMQQLLASDNSASVEEMQKKATRRLEVEKQNKSTLKAKLEKKEKEMEAKISAHQREVKAANDAAEHERKTSLLQAKKHELQSAAAKNRLAKERLDAIEKQKSLEELLQQNDALGELCKTLRRENFNLGEKLAKYVDGICPLQELKINRMTDEISELKLQLGRRFESSRGRDVKAEIRNTEKGGAGGTNKLKEIEASWIQTQSELVKTKRRLDEVEELNKQYLMRLSITESQAERLQGTNRRQAKTLKERAVKEDVLRSKVQRSAMDTQKAMNERDVAARGLESQGRFYASIVLSTILRMLK